MSDPSQEPLQSSGTSGAPAPPAYAAYGRADYGSAAPVRRRSRWFWPGIIGGVVLLLALMLGGIVWAVVRMAHSDDEESGSAGLGKSQKIAVIDVNGVLVTADPVAQQLRKFADDDDVKAIILHINSPGGGAAVSQELYNEVLRVRQEKHKRVVASIESVGASGAYYIASACDRIYANNASVVGSIGVIMEWTQYGDLLRWAKMKPVVLHAGKLKDAGDPTRDITPEEQAYFQSLIDNMYAQFIHDVATGRGVSDSKIQPLATGQVWTGQQALPLGLIDQAGGFRVALMDTAKQVGISGEPGIVRPPKQKGLLAALANSDADSLLPNPVKIMNQAPGFYFMWR